MNNDFLLNDDEDLISKFNGSFRKALDKSNTKESEVVLSSSNKKTRMNKKRKEDHCQDDKVPMKNIQIRVSPETLLKIKKIQIMEFEQSGKQKPIKLIVDEIISKYCTKDII